jgi:hypothetical protein
MTNIYNGGVMATSPCVDADSLPKHLQWSRVALVVGRSVTRGLGVSFEL